MLQNCYKLHTFVTIDGDVKSGRFSTKKCIVKSGCFSTVSDNAQDGKKSTTSDNVQNGKKSTRKYIVRSGTRNAIQGSSRARGRGRAELALGLIRAGRAGSWKLLQQAGLRNAHEASWKEKKEEKIMKFYVVDQWGQYIDEFEYRDEAERFCDKWNKVLRFNEWSEPKAHVIEGE